MKYYFGNLIVIWTYLMTIYTKRSFKQKVQKSMMFLSEELFMNFALQNYNFAFILLKIHRYKS